MDQYTHDREEIIERFSKLLDEKYMNLKETGKFAPSDIGKEIGKIIGEYNIKKKYKSSSYSEPLSSGFENDAYSCDVLSCASTQCLSPPTEAEFMDYSCSLCQFSSPPTEPEFIEPTNCLIEYSNFFRTLFE